MKYCPHCGEELSVRATFCADCGERIVPSEDRPTDEPSPTDPEPVTIAKGSSRWGVFLSVAAFALILVGSLGPWWRRCGDMATFEGRPIACRAYETVGMGDGLGIATLAIAAGMIVLLLDDYFSFGLIETWRPRKARLNFIAGVVIFLSLFIVAPSDGDIAWGGAMIGVGSLVLIAFSAVVFVIAFGFQKHIGFR